MTTKTIKGVDDDTWFRFKSLALKNRMDMGKLLGEMIKEYESKSSEFWKDVLYGEKLLNEKEAEELIKETVKLRKEHGFRK
ncbi:hypothetical protein J4440_02905 [Candidatus Woesearchaeota archaeon]|nr:hypothetical protein [Candidatus Woesearchaeota archaeon]